MKRNIKNMVLKQNIKNMVLAAMFLAIGMVLPIFTGQIRVVGKMLLPMHLPVLLCGLICGWQYGGVVGFVLPFLRFAVFGMPPMPNGVAMAFELAAYGIIVGVVYSRSRWQCVIALYRSLLIAMVGGHHAPAVLHSKQNPRDPLTARLPFQRKAPKNAPQLEARFSFPLWDGRPWSNRKGQDPHGRAGVDCDRPAAPVHLRDSAACQRVSSLQKPLLLAGRDQDKAPAGSAAWLIFHPRADLQRPFRARSLVGGGLSVYPRLPGADKIQRQAQEQTARQQVWGGWRRQRGRVEGSFSNFCFATCPLKFPCFQDPSDLIRAKRGPQAI